MAHPTHIHRSSKKTGTPHDWRCTRCAGLLGKRAGDSVLIQFARGHRYRASLPVTAVCRRCSTLNET